VAAAGYLLQPFGRAGTMPSQGKVHNVKSSSSLGSENVKSSSSLGSAGKAVLLGANRPKPPPPPHKTKRLKLAFGRISHKYSCRD